MPDIPPLVPDWDHPQPYDGPTPEETRAYGDLKEAADHLDVIAHAIRAWVTGAYLHPPDIHAWAALEQRLRDLENLGKAAADGCVRMGSNTERTVAGDRRE